MFAPTEDGGWKGSGRSLPGLHLRDAIDVIYKKNPSWFVKFGGHAMAAGLSLTAEGRAGFADAFEEVVKNNYDGIRPQQYLVSDGQLPLDQMTVHTARHLSLNVWGQGFEEPLWVGEFRVHQVDMIGKDKNHLKMIVSPLGSFDAFTALHFFQEDKIPQPDQIIRLAYRLQASVFGGEEKLDLIIADRD